MLRSSVKPFVARIRNPLFHRALIGSVILANALWGSPTS